MFFFVIFIFFMLFLLFLYFFSNFGLHGMSGPLGMGYVFYWGGLYRKFREGCLGIVVNFWVRASLRVGLGCCLSLSIKGGISLWFMNCSNVGVPVMLCTSVVCVVLYRLAAIFSILFWIFCNWLRFERGMSGYQTGDA